MSLFLDPNQATTKSEFDGNILFGRLISCSFYGKKSPMKGESIAKPGGSIIYI